MATAIVIVSNEGGVERAVTIAATKEAARQVAGICKRIKGSRFVGADTMAAPRLLADAYGVMGEEWEKAVLSS